MAKVSVYGVIIEQVKQADFPPLPDWCVTLTARGKMRIKVLPCAWPEVERLVAHHKEHGGKLTYAIDTILCYQRDCYRNASVLTALNEFITRWHSTRIHDEQDNRRN